MRPITDLMLGRFPYFIGFYFLVHLILRVASNNTLTIDESEQMLLAQYFSWGYNSQPPLYTWIQIVFFDLFGHSILSIAVLKHLFLFLLYLFTYFSAKEVTQDKSLAALCSMSMILLFEIGWSAQIDQIHSVAVTTAAAATLYWFLRIARREQTMDYCFLGVAVGCGILFKYNFVLLIVALVLVSLLSSDLRSRVVNYKILLCIAATAILILPHTIWFVRHLSVATTETIQRMHVDQGGNALNSAALGLFDFSTAIIAFISPFWLVFWVTFRKQIQSSRYPQARWLSYNFLVLLVLLSLLIVFSGTTNVKERWLQPYFFCFPMWAFLHIDAVALRRKAARWASLAAFFMLIVLIAIPLRLITIDFTGKPHRENYPFDALAAKIRANGFQSGTIVAQDMFLGGNLRLFFPDATVSAPQFPNSANRPGQSVLHIWHDQEQAAESRMLMDSDAACFDFQNAIQYKYSTSFVYRPFYTLCP